MDASASAARHRRVTAIARAGLLERSGDPALTALTRVTAYVTGAPAAAVHVLDDALQHRVAATGAPLGTHPRADSMCRLVVDGEQRIVCADATQDARFGASSFVRGPSPVRFYASVPLRTMDGTVVGTLCSWDVVERELSDEQLARLEDIAEQVAARVELSRLAAELAHAASTDPLTGLPNRVVLEDRLAQAFARTARHATRVLVALLDVDGFKALNDTLGHEAGDDVLREIAGRLRAALREEDTAARLGGDEFVVVAEVDADAADAATAALAERLAAAFAPPVVLDGRPHEVGVTIGVAVAEPGDDARRAVARADGAMYARKPGRAGVLTG